MIPVKLLFSYFKKKDINFFAGVPDSILKDTNDILKKFSKDKHIVTHNEGGAIALGAGYYLKNKKIPCIYLQNSGLGNIVNPIMSMAHKKVYSVPMLLLIGWRGASNQKDEPQHIQQGKITEKMLKLMDIDYCILNNSKDLNKLGKIIDISKKKEKPVACLIKKNVIKNQNNKKIVNKNSSNLKRYEIIDYIISKRTRDLKIFSTTGYTSRELFEIKKTKNQIKKDFYNVGAMGHTSMIAFGYSLKNKNKIVLCLDGDGSLLMHMGSLCTIGENGSRNFKHIVFNNKQHESVGGQKTPVTNTNFKFLAISCGYKRYFYAKSLKKFKKNYNQFIKSKGPCLFEIIISPGTLKHLGRPNNFLNIKKNF